MHDPSKTYQELIEENSLLKRKIQELEQSEKKHKDMEEALRESEEKYRILLSESPDPTFSFTADGQYRYVNRAFAEGVGKSVEEIVGKSIWAVFPKEEADKRFAALRQVFLSGEEKVIEVCVPRADGDRYYVTTITPISDAKGEIISVICSSKDITDRKRAEEEREGLITELQNALSEVKTLSGLLPICASCKKIRDDKGYWNQIESYIREHSGAEFTHGICPECMKTLHPELYKILIEKL
jgi:PAS domain S-box-containing protein